MLTRHCRCCPDKERLQPNFTWKDYFRGEKFTLECCHCGTKFRRSRLQKLHTNAVAVLGLAGLIIALHAWRVPAVYAGLSLPAMCILVNLGRVIILRWTPWEIVKKGTAQDGTQGSCFL